MTVAVLAAGVMPAGAALGHQKACAAREAVIANLGQMFREAPVAIGMASNGGVIEVLSSPGGETWTIIITMPSGVACAVASGKYWQDIPYHLNGKKL